MTSLLHVHLNGQCYWVAVENHVLGLYQDALRATAFNPDETVRYSAIIERFYNGSRVFPLDCELLSKTYLNSDQRKLMRVE